MRPIEKHVLHWKFFAQRSIAEVIHPHDCASGSWLDINILRTITLNEPLLVEFRLKEDFIVDTLRNIHKCLALSNLIAQRKLMIGPISVEVHVKP